MRCLDAAQIARAATMGDAVPHLGECLTCRRQYEADRAAREAIQQLPAPQLSAAHKRALAAELIAAAQHEPAPRSRRGVAIGSAVLAAAAAAALIAQWPRATTAETPGAPGAVAAEDTAMSSALIAYADPPPPSLPPLVMKLVEGTLELDTRSSRAVSVHVGDSVIRVESAAVTIRAHHHAIVSVNVVVGAARIDSPEQHLTLQRDTLWLPGPTPAQRSMTAFRDGWLALRAGNNREAMALFDRVTDPVAHEEASYWAAIAAKRSGDSALAAERLARFLREFPNSQYADQLRGD